MPTVESQSQGSLHFWTLCAEKGLTDSAVRELWAATRRNDPDPKRAARDDRNVKRFFDGAGIGNSTRPLVVEFCRTHLELNVSDHEFDLGERFTDFVGKFANNNGIYRTLDLLKGDYSLFRPRVDSGSGKLIFERKCNLLAHPLKIFPEGKTGRYAFELTVVSDQGRTKWEGHALCSELHLHLIGFSNDVLSMILTPLGSRSSGVLVGAQFMKIVQGANTKVVGRVAAAARLGRGFEQRRETAEQWLRQHDDQSSAGFVVSLSQSPIGHADS